MPATVKAKKGKRKAKVSFFFDKAGNVDASPAKARVTVKVTKKK